MVISSMQYLDQPIYKKEGSTFILYKANFSTGEPGFSEHTFVAGGNSLEVGRFNTLEELQAKSTALFGQRATEAEN
jgi:hypothetical protein